jgi:putative flippase GtrA
VVSTIAYALLFLAFRHTVGSQMANVFALCLTAIGNTAANRRITFGVQGPAGALRHHAQGLLVFLLGLGLTAGSLALLDGVWPLAPASVELGILIAANLVTTVGRFIALRLWVFPHHRALPEIGA